MSDEKATRIHPLKICSVAMGIISISLCLGTAVAINTQQSRSIITGLAFGTLGSSLGTVVSCILAALIPSNHNHLDIPSTSSHNRLTQADADAGYEGDTEDLSFSDEEYTPISPSRIIQ